MHKNAIRLFLAGCLLASVAIVPAQANSILLSSPVVTQIGPSDWEYTYTATLTSNSSIGGGLPSFFTIFDFVGLLPASVTETLGAGWASTQPNTGTVAFLQAPPDNAAVPNLVFTYTGTQINGEVVLGTVTAHSVYGPGANGVYNGQDFRTTDQTVQGNIGLIPESFPNDRNVPEPTTLVLVGGALVWAGLLRRNRV